jgi:uncharacterized membrane protein
LDYNYLIIKTEAHFMPFGELKKEQVMESLMIILRVIHILSGIFWVGTNLFNIFFLEPTIKSAGPAGGAVMGKLSSGKFPVVIAIASILTVIAGFVMYVIDSKGFQASWILSPGPLTLTVGATAGIAAAAVGLFVQRPTLLRMTTLQKQIQQAGGQPTPEQAAELNKLLVQFTGASRWAAVLMVIAVIGMESAREVGSIE